VAPLAMMGWGAGLGGLVGAAMGAGTADKPAEPAAQQESWRSTLVADAIASGQFVLMVQTQNEAETDAARNVIGAAVGDYKDMPGEPEQAKKPG
jgi:hypothetical protein